MRPFQITPDLDATALGLSSDQTAVYQLLCSRRQCTSTELIKLCQIKNPHELIESINQQLKAHHSEWQIFASVTRAPLNGPTQSMRTPVGYYRLHRNTSLREPRS